MLRIVGEAGGGLAALDAISEALGMMGVRSNGVFGQLSSTMKRYEQDAQRTADAVVAARETEAAAAGRLSVAEAKMQSLRQKGVDDVGRLAAAENAITIARNNHTKAISGVSKAEEEAAGATARSESAIGKMGSALGGIPSGYAAAAAGAVVAAGVFVDFAVKSIEAASDYETLTTRLVTSAGLQKGSLDAVKTGMIDMASQVGISAEDLAKGMFVVSSGMEHVADPAQDAANALAILKASAQGAAMEGADLGHVADAVGTALVDYHMDASQAATVTSKLKEAAALGKTNFNDLASSMSAITPTAASYGISLESILAALSEMTKHGESAQQSSQNLADTIRELEKPNAQAAAEMANFGIQASDLSQSLSDKGLGGTLDMISDKIMSKMGPDGKVMLDTFNTSKVAAQNLQTAIHALPPQLQDLANKFNAGDIGAKAFTGAADKLGGESGKLAKEIVNMKDKAEGFSHALQSGSPQAQSFAQALTAVMGDATAAKTAMMLLGANSADVNTIFGKLKGTTAQTNGDVKGMSDVNATAAQKFKDLKQAAHEVALDFGTALLPAAKAVADGLMNAIKWLKDHPAAMEAVKKAAEALAIGLAAIAIAIAAVLIAIGIFVAMIGGLVGGIAWLTGEAEKLGHKVGEWLGDQFSKGAKIASEAWDGVKTKLSEIWTWIKTKASEIGKAFSDAWNGVKGKVTQIWDDIKKAITDKISEIGHAISNNKLVQDIEKMFSSIGGFLHSLWDFIARHAKQIWDDICSAASTAWNTLKSTAETVWNDIKNAIIKPIEDLASQIGEKWDGVKNTVSQKWDDLKTAASNIWNDIKTTIAGVISDILSTLEGWATDAYNAFIKPVVDAYTTISGKVGDWVSLGGDLIMGLVKGVVAMAGRLVDAAVNAVAGAFTAAMNWLDSHSPSRRAARELGAPISQGIAVGIDEHAHLVSGSMVSMLRSGFNTSGNLLGSMSLPMGGLGSAGAHFGQANGAAQSVVNVHFNGPYYGAGGTAQVAQDVRTELLKLKVRTPLGL